LALAYGLMPELGDEAFHLVNELVTDLVKVDALAAGSFGAAPAPV
jgi:hypothetical protein